MNYQKSIANDYLGFSVAFTSSLSLCHRMHISVSSIHGINTQTIIQRSPSGLKQPFNLIEGL